MSPASGEDAGPGLDGLGGENAAAAVHGLPYFAVDDLVAALKPARRRSSATGEAPRCISPSPSTARGERAAEERQRRP
jgi:hypothetical protein